MWVAKCCRGSPSATMFDPCLVGPKPSHKSADLSRTLKSDNSSTTTQAPYWLLCDSCVNLWCCAVANLSSMADIIPKIQSNKALSIKKLLQVRLSGVDLTQYPWMQSFKYGWQLKLTCGAMVFDPGGFCCNCTFELCNLKLLSLSLANLITNECKRSVKSLAIKSTFICIAQSRGG